MRIIKSLKEMHKYSQQKKNHGKSIAFVPTMGCLHDGHLSLVEAAKKAADIVVVSIFVNPTQFGPGEDYKHYPKDLRRDKKLLKNFEVDVLFMPEAKDVFPQGYKTFVEVEELSNKLCGISRPTHFRGVATILTKLFNLVQPAVVLLGEKDFQQLVIVKQLIKDLAYPIKVISCPTVREYDGLAMSSRNKYLSAKERDAATLLYKSLLMAKESVENGEKDLRKIMVRLRSTIGAMPQVRLDYVTLVNPETLEEVKKIKKGRHLLAIAAQIGKARLIDNLLIKV